MPSFKVPCPSCEAKVLIKNPNLVGTKVECPKCKYRFKVEAPAEETPADAGKGAKDAKQPAAAETKADDAGKKKKKPAKNNKKVLIGVGAGALVLLLIVGAVVFGGGGDDKTGGGGGGGGFVAGGGGGGGANTSGEGGDNNTEKKDGPGQASKPTTPHSDKDATNLLPNQTVAVYRFNVEQLRQTPIAGHLFDPAMAKLFEASMGFDAALIELYFHCAVGADRAPFGLIRLREPRESKDLTAKVAGLGNAKAVNGKDLYPIKGNPFLSAIGQTLAARSLLGDLYEKVPGRATASDKPLGLCVYDTQHVIIGDLAVVEKFLGELKDGYPEFRSKLLAPPEPPSTPGGMPPAGGMGPGAGASTPPGTGPGAGAAAPPGTGPGAGASVPPGLGTPPGAGGMPPANPPAPPPAPSGAKDNRQLTNRAGYLSIEPDLKSMLNALEDPANPPMVLVAEKFDPKAYDPTQFKQAYESLGSELAPILSRVDYVGLNLILFNTRQLRGTVRIVGKSIDDARNIALERLGPALTGAMPGLSLAYNTAIEFKNYAASSTPGGPNPGGYGPTGPGGMGVPGGGSSLGPPPGIGGGSSLGPPPGGAGGSSLGPPPGIGGGSSLGPPPGGAGGSSLGPPPGIGGSGGKPMPPGMPPGMGMPGDMTGEGNQPTTPKGTAPSQVELSMVDQVVTIFVNINWHDDAYTRIVAPKLFGLSSQIKGKMTVYSGDYSIFPLAGAVAKLSKSGFPAGTSPRSGGDRFALPYPPDQRCSFFVELLPYLGRDGIARGVDRSRGWLDDRNLIASEAWVPELLVWYSPPSSWRATSPRSDGRVFGGTSFVAVAGIGPDAARYNPKKFPDQAKTVGITGYDWGSKPGEIADGLDKTIYLIQVPPGLSRPWIAGGGATVVGLNPVNPMADFAHVRPDGKAGTHAIMADGTVRWIPAEIDPKHLLAMATRAGGEPLPADLDEIAPKVESPKKPKEAKLTSGTDTTAPMTPAPAPTDKDKKDSPKTDDKDKTDAPKADAPKTEAPAPKEK